MRLFFYLTCANPRLNKGLWALWIGCLFLGGYNTCFALPPQDLIPAISKLEDHIQKNIKQRRIPGCAVAIVYRNQVVYINSYGSKILGKNEKIDLDTVFQLGSVSKPVAATLASILEHKGLLRLDDPVNRYLPGFSLNSIQDARTLKITNILSHSSGVSRAGFNNLIEAYAPYDQILKALQKTPVRTPVGRKYDYNNAMFSVISRVTEVATKQSFKDALNTHLLHPLNMTRTTATLSGIANDPNRAAPHTKNHNGVLTASPTYSKGYYTVAPAGGINSSIRDMAIFLKAQMGGYPHIVNNQVLSRIHTPHIATQNALRSFGGSRRLVRYPHYGLGWRIVNFADHRLLFHGGWLKGFTNFIGFMPEQQIGIVILHNADTRFSTQAAVKFLEGYLDAVDRANGKTIPTPLKTTKTVQKGYKLKPAQKNRTLTTLKTLKKAKVVNLMKKQQKKISKKQKKVKISRAV